MNDTEVRNKRNILFWIIPLVIVALAVSVYIVTRPDEDSTNDDGGGGGGNPSENNSGVNVLAIVLPLVVVVFIAFFVVLIFRTRRDNTTKQGRDIVVPQQQQQEPEKEPKTEKEKEDNPKKKKSRRSSWVSRLSKAFSAATGTTNLVQIEEDATTPQKRYDLAKKILESNSNLAWGNEYTLKIAADAYNRPIHVMNTETKTEVVYGENKTGYPIYLNFHWEVDSKGKHVLGGEHYSVRIPQQEIIGDGFCQFRSLAFVVKNGNQNAYQEVKEDLLRHLKRNKNEILEKVLNAGEDVHKEVPRSIMLKTMTIPALEERIGELEKEIKDMVQREGEKVKNTAEYIKTFSLLENKKLELEGQQQELLKFQGEK